MLCAVNCIPTTGSTVLRTPESLLDLGPASWLLLIDGALGRDDLNKLYQKHAPPTAPTTARLERHQVVGAIVGHAIERSKHGDRTALDAMSQIATKRSRTETKLLTSLTVKSAVERLTTYGGMQFKKQRSRMLWAALCDPRPELAQAGHDMLKTILQAAQSGKNQIKLPTPKKSTTSKAIPSLATPQDSATLGKLRRMLEQKNTQIDELRSTILNLHNQHAKVRGEERRDREHIQHQKSVHSDQRSELVELKKTHQELKNKLDQMIAQHNDAQQTIEHIKQDLDNAHRNHKEQLEAEQNRHQNEQTAWQRERHALLNKEQQAPHGVVVLFDAANLGAGARAAGGNLDFVSVLKRLVRGRQLRHAQAFAVAPKGAERQRFELLLRQAAIHVQWKEKQVFSDGSSKADWDVGLAVAAMQWAGRVETIILASGDGDFLPLVDALKRQGTQLEVAGWPGRIHQAWEQQAHQVTLFDSQDLIR